MPRHVSLALTLLPFLAAAGAAPSAGQGPLGETWRWARFTRGTGLPSDAVHAVLETPQRVWAATDSGLAWFDGFVWHAMGPDAGLPAAPAAALAADSIGRMAALIGGRLYTGETGGFAAVPLDGDTAWHASGLAPWPEGGWVMLGRRGTVWSLRLVDDSGARALEPPAPLGTGTVPRLWGRTGRVWLNTARGLFARDARRWRLVLPTGSVGLEVASIAAGAGGGLASVTAPAERRGLWAWGPDLTPRRQASEGGNAALGLSVATSGDAVVVYETGHVRVRRAGAWRSADELPPVLRSVLSVAHRPNGDVWVATRRGLFLYRASSTRWSGRARPFPDERNRIHAILYARDGTLWAGTGDGVEIHRAGGRYEWVNAIAGVRLGPVTSVTEDAAGDVWVSSGSSFRGAFRWDGRAWRRFGRADGLADAYVHRVALDRGGRLWFLGLPEAGDAGSRGPGVFVREGGRIRRWGPDTALPSRRVFAFAEGLDGARWFGTAAGLSRWRAGQWTHWTAAEGLRGRGVFTLVVDDSSDVWFGDRSGGLGRVDRNDRLTYLTERDGLIDDAVWDLRFDARGRLWIATAGGLCVYAQGTWSHFDTDMGLASPHLWPVLPVSDSVYVGTIGQSIQVLSLAEGWDPPPRVLLEPPALEGGVVRLRWTPVAWWGALPASAIETRYRIDRGAWVPWNREHAATLSGLGFGRHVVQVQAKGFAGGFDAPGVRVAFTVPPPVVLRPAFALPFAALSVTIVALGAAGVRRRRRHEHDLRRSEARFRLLAGAAFEGVAVVEHGRIADANRRLADLLGRDLATLPGIPFDDTVAPESRDLVRERVDAASNEPFEYAALRSDGTVFPAEARATVLPYGEGVARAVAVRDVTARRQLEDTLTQVASGVSGSAREAEAFAGLTGRLAGAVGADAALLAELTPERDRLRVVVGMARGAPLAPRDVALTGSVLAGGLGAEGAVRVRAARATFPADGLIRDLGLEAWVAVALRAADGAPLGVLAVGYRADAPDPVRTESLLRIFAARAAAELERRRAETALRASEALFRSIIDNATAGIYVKRADGRYLLLNKEFERASGINHAEAVGRTDYDLFPREAAEAFRRHDLEVLRAGHALEYEETVAYAKGTRSYLSIKFPLFDAQGRPYATGGISTEITERKRLEAQLVQAQKMEGIGRLAGGVAHDFNNLLTAILGYADIVYQSLGPGDPRRADVDELRQAGQRAANLTRQLLAFARRQAVEPRVLSLNELVGNMGQMLRRVVGEDVEVVAALDPRLWPVRADPGQLEQVVVNLVVNARDAMPGGGRVTIATRALELETELHPGIGPGRVAELSVTDTGVGMSKDILARLFEPFFTTKDVGKGTGLGLATCYGIVKQAGGHISAYSEPGRGATFRVYLPAAGAAVAPATAPTPAFEDLPRGVETILLVEDEPQVRELAVRTLRRQGYTVLVATDGAEALRVAGRQDRPPHLLLTDLVLPHMSGHDLAVRLREWMPQMRVLFMSGYTERAVVPEGEPNGGAFLPKPFTPALLAQKVRQVLDGNGP
jgi:PAS domain S-box-containing protein